MLPADEECSSTATSASAVEAAVSSQARHKECAMTRTVDATPQSSTVVSAVHAAEQDMQR